MPQHRIQISYHQNTVGFLYFTSFDLYDIFSEKQELPQNCSQLDFQSVFSGKYISIFRRKYLKGYRLGLFAAAPYAWSLSKV